ncbi:MAG: serine/threonine-protein kinase [Dokdonella sp.]|uniref:protein kinase domain-containing protein n=2 Tax=Dokdonella sp. TaxID=2291710 RepID=UPI003BB0FFEF
MTDSMTLRELFEQALALAAGERAAFVAACTDEATRQRLARMLSADDDGKPLFDKDASVVAERLGTINYASSLPPGSRIGPFELAGVLGEGGSSIVFRATRTLEGVRQEVALKLLRHGLYSPDAQRQFRRERLALAQLDHPGIARLIEGGITEAGLAYIVLDLIDGTPLTDHAREHRLEPRARLDLFLQVCRAVEAAHRALIVHRDLKPSNVLVARGGQVKLLDFGIAKLLQNDEETQTRLPAFTPSYAAPEQKAGGLVTTATDVYALGVLLGELMTGERLGGGQTPSGQVRDGHDPGVLPAPPQATRRLLRGDLDNIVLKAIEDDPTRRYASASAFADDIERLLDGRPVAAHPPSRWYRARKFVLRHKVGVAGSCIFLLAILASLGSALWQARLAHNASTRANATLAFVVDLLKTASADLPADQRPTPAALVAEAAENAREDPDLDPMVRAQLLFTLAEVARSNGDTLHAEQLIDEAITRARALGVEASSPEWIAMLVCKGNLLHTTGRTTEADRLMEGLLPSLEGVDTEGAVSALMLYAATRAYAGDADRGVLIAKQALKKAQRVFGADSTDGIETATYLGQLCASLRRYRESELILDEAIQRWQRLGLPRNEQLARSIFYLARSKDGLGRQDEVEALYKEGIALMRSVREAPFHRLPQGLVGYADFLIDSERHDEAKQALDEALRIDLATRGPDDARTAMTVYAHANFHNARHEDVDAEQRYRAAVEVLQALAKSSGYEPELARARLDWTGSLIALGKIDQAAALHAAVMPDLSQHFGAQSGDLADGLCVGAALKLARGGMAKALQDTDRALAILHALDIPLPQSEIHCLQVRATALVGLQRGADARIDAARAVVRQQQTHPLAIAKLTGLLALRARAERADADPDAAMATVAQARQLGASVGLLSSKDRETLEFALPKLP